MPVTETLIETIARELTFLIACEGEQYERVATSIRQHVAML